MDAQNKRQRVKAKAKEHENGELRKQHAGLKQELERERSREKALEQEVRRNDRRRCDNSEHPIAGLRGRYGR